MTEECIATIILPLQVCAPQNLAAEVIQECAQGTCPWQHDQQSSRRRTH